MDQHYSPEFITEQKSRLEAQRQELKTELEKIARFDEASGSYIPLQPEYDADTSEDSGDSSLESEVEQTNDAIMTNLETTLNEVEAALAKIEDGSYGVCESSGDYISEERLTAYPAARTCDSEMEAN
ncbi:MAG: TraR/DksA C4-type zinc finger protein [Patescibacteria group bacterium]